MIFVKFGKTLVAFSALALAVLGLASCNKGENPQGSTVAPTATTSATTAESGSSMHYLTFLQDSKLRVDILDNVGCTFKYGGQALTSGQVVALNSTAKFTKEGTATPETLDFIIVTETGTPEHFTSSVSPSLGILVESLDQWLDEVLSADLQGVNKMYVAISIGGNHKWTKNLNAELDDKLELLVK